MTELEKAEACLAESKKILARLKEKADLELDLNLKQTLLGKIEMEEKWGVDFLQSIVSRTAEGRDLSPKQAEMFEKKVAFYLKGKTTAEKPPLPRFDEEAAMTKIAITNMSMALEKIEAAMCEPLKQKASELRVEFDKWEAKLVNFELPF